MARTVRRRISGLIGASCLASVLALSVAVPAAHAAPQASAPTASPAQAQESVVNNWCGRYPYRCGFDNRGFFGNNVLGFNGLGFNNGLGYNGLGFFNGYGCPTQIVDLGNVTVARLGC